MPCYKASRALAQQKPVRNGCFFYVPTEVQSTKVTGLAPKQGRWEFLFLKDAAFTGLEKLAAEGKTHQNHPAFTSRRRPLQSCIEPLLNTARGSYYSGARKGGPAKLTPTSPPRNSQKAVFLVGVPVRLFLLQRRRSRFAPQRMVPGHGLKTIVAGLENHR